MTPVRPTPRLVTPSPELILSFRASLRACMSCELSRSATPVPWSGDVRPDLLVIGEAPGETENREGKPMVGPAGQRLRYFLRESGLANLSTAYVDTVSCWPTYKNRAPQPEHVRACRSWFRGQVGIIEPAIVLTVGLTAFNAVRGTARWPGLAELHGKPMFWQGAPSPSKPRLLWSTYHPANALPNKRQSGKYTRIITEDLVTLKAFLDVGEPFGGDCYLCGSEFYRFDEEGFGISLCKRHAQRQNNLFPEDVLANLEA